MTMKHLQSARCRCSVLWPIKHLQDLKKLLEPCTLVNETPVEVQGDNKTPAGVQGDNETPAGVQDAGAVYSG